MKAPCQCSNGSLVWRLIDATAHWSDICPNLTQLIQPITPNPNLNPNPSHNPKK